MKVLIIGAGVIGLLTARRLHHEGCQVIVVDAAPEGRPASWAGGGILSPLYPWRYPVEIQQLTASADQYYLSLQQELLALDASIDIEVEAQGMLVLEPEDAPEARQWGARQGVSLRSLEAGEIQRSWPYLKRGVEGLWFSECAHVRNPRLLRALRIEMIQKGILFSESLPVQAMVRSGDRLESVRLRNGNLLEADHYVVCAGPWSAGLLVSCGLELPIQPVRGQMLAYRDPSQGQMRAMVLYQGRYLIPRRDGVILVGSTVEEVGFDASVTPMAREALQGFAEDLVPMLRGQQPFAQWAGLRPASPRGVPFIGSLLYNLWVSTGHFRNGLVMAPASAELLADLMLGRTPLLDPAPYQPRHSLAK